MRAIHRSKSRTEVRILGEMDHYIADIDYTEHCYVLEDTKTLRQFTTPKDTFDFHYERIDSDSITTNETRE
jgi:hypothetical protein